MFSLRGRAEPCMLYAVTSSSSETGFQLRLDAFEGPLDLLLRLIEQEELDITTVSLVQVTDQYLSYLRSAPVTNFEALADFIAIAAKLIFLKSRALLPRPPDEEPDEQPEDHIAQADGNDEGEQDGHETQNGGFGGRHEGSTTRDERR